MSILSIQDLSKQVWAKLIEDKLVNIETGLYDKGFHILGDEPPTINHFDMLFHNYDRKMNYALNQIFNVISTAGLAIDENLSANLYNAIKKMIPPKTNYVQQNVDETIQGKKTFIDSISFIKLINANNTLNANISIQNDNTFKFYLKDNNNNISEYSLGHNDDYFLNEIPSSNNNRKEIVTGGKLHNWWQRNNPLLTERTNVGLQNPVPIINLDSNAMISDLPSGYVGVANVSNHPDLKYFNFSNNLVYIHKIANSNNSNSYVQIRGVGTRDSDMLHEGVSTGNRNVYTWRRESTNYELIKMFYPVGVCIFFAYNINPNNLWAGSGMQWQYISENKVVRLGRADGADLWEYGGNDVIRLQEGHMPRHTHDFGATTSWDNEKTIWTSVNGNHNHGVNVGNGRTQMSWYKWSWADGRANVQQDGTSWAGDHNHSFVVPGHNHYVSGTTTAKGENWDIWVTNPYVKLMGWFRKQ